VANKTVTGEPQGSPSSGFRRLTADEILSLDDRNYEDVEVPEWSTVVAIRSMTGVERDRLESTMIETRGRNRQINLQNMRARTVAACAVDKNPKDDPGGSPPKLLFSPAQVSDLGRKNASAIQRLFNVAQKLSGISQEDVDELTVDLGNDQSGDSGSN
jgi:hypothetical protein